MWPKLLPQLFELLPHVSRLVPMAEKFFASKAVTEKGNEAALTSMAEGVRGELGQIAQAHSSLNRQLYDQSLKLDAVAEQARLTQLAMEQREHRVEHLVQQVATLTLWVRTSAVLIILLLFALIAIALRLHR